MRLQSSTLVKLATGNPAPPQAAGKSPAHFIPQPPTVSSQSPQNKLAIANAHHCSNKAAVQIAVSQVGEVIRSFLLYCSSVLFEISIFQPYLYCCSQTLPYSFFCRGLQAGWCRSPLRRPQCTAGNVSPVFLGKILMSLKSM